MMSSRGGSPTPAVRSLLAKHLVMHKQPQKRLNYGTCVMCTLFRGLGIRVGGAVKILRTFVRISAFVK